MSSANICPGLLFATLVVQLVQANGFVVSPMVARRKGGESGDPCGDDDCGGHITTVIQTQTVIMSVSASAPSNHSSSSRTNSLPTPASSSLVPSLPSPPSPTLHDPQVDSVPVKRQTISTGGIVGAVLGSLIILGLGLMLLTKCITRSRKARKRPRGFVKSGDFSQPRPDSPTTEMSETQFPHPVLSSALVAQATSGPIPYSHSFATFTTDNTDKTFKSSSTSPLIPGTNATPSVTNSSARRTSLSYTDISSEAGHPLPSPYETSMLSSWHASQASSGFGGAALSLSAVAMAATSSSAPLSPLHRSMTAFQKSLEDEANKGNVTGDIHHHDPPPQYNA